MSMMETFGRKERVSVSKLASIIAAVPNKRGSDTHGLDVGADMIHSFEGMMPLGVVSYVIQSSSQ